MAEIQNGRVTVPKAMLAVEEMKDLEAGVVAPSGTGRRWRRTSYRSFGSFSFSPKSNGVGAGRFFCEDDGHHHHFLDSCFLCRKPLGGHRDIFMYRGDTPFCSEECREEQIAIDEGKGKNWTNLAMKASSRKEQKSSTAQAIHVRAAGAIVAG